jgi:hypothetical protein
MYRIYQNGDTKISLESGAAYCRILKNSDKARGHEGRVWVDDQIDISIIKSVTCCVFGQLLLYAGDQLTAVKALRATEINNCPKIAPDFGPDSRRGKGRIIFYVTLAATQKLGQKTSKIG